MATVMAFGVVAGVASDLRGRPGVVDVRRVDRRHPRRHPELLDAGDARRLRTAVRGDPRRPRVRVLARATRRRTATTVARPRRRTRRSPATRSTAATVTSSPTTSRVCCPSCASNFGEFAVGLVFAHELGHAVQARVGYDPSATVYLEQQADCFAGAWAQHVADSDDENVHLSTDDLDNALAGSADPERPVGHRRRAGRRARQRLRPGQRVPGRLRGRRGRRAPTTRTTPPDVTESGYTSYADQASDGNLPLDELVPTVTKSLDDYWASQSSKLTAPTVSAGGATTTATTEMRTVACSPTPSPTTPSTNTVHYDADDDAGRARHHRRLRQRHARGDRVGVVGAAPARHRASAPTHARRGAECLAGAWTANLSSSLSPGDLDEAVTVLVAAGKGNTDRGTAFDRVAAFRAGFKHGPSKCVQSS